ncbi:MAG TPA: 50S ribosomal protein L13 [Candidatus Polarisedimenticolaceae bacterium]|nr:50S ribosomal protein L13 [Candidatus Polarisedimenticolaceae bacterium]
MTTYVPRPQEIENTWWLVNADGLTLGRLASEVALRLRGKRKPQYTPYLDTGDHVIVVNAEKAVLTGNKLQDKMYRRHSGYPGGLTEITAAKLRARYPERLIEYAVQGMLPKGPLGRKLVRKLKVYAGPNHPHAAQQPRPLALPQAAARVR